MGPPLSLRPPLYLRAPLKTTDILPEGADDTIQRAQLEMYSLISAMNSDKDFPENAIPLLGSIVYFPITPPSTKKLEE
jgi:hypothetical protein